jgi:hypothetical protein
MTEVRPDHRMNRWNQQSVSSLTVGVPAFKFDEKYHSIKAFSPAYHTQQLNLAIKVQFIP